MHTEHAAVQEALRQLAQEPAFVACHTPLWCRTTPETWADLAEAVVRMVARITPDTSVLAAAQHKVCKWFLPLLVQSSCWNAAAGAHRCKC